jgi:hypothetical protein
VNHSSDGKSAVARGLGIGKACARVGHHDLQEALQIGSNGMPQDWRGSSVAAVSEDLKLGRGKNRCLSSEAGKLTVRMPPQQWVET